MVTRKMGIKFPMSNNLFSGQAFNLYSFNFLHQLPFLFQLITEEHQKGKILLKIKWKHWNFETYHIIGRVCILLHCDYYKYFV